MAQLSSLPNEVRNHILGLIPTSDLARLCLVRRSLRQYAEPFLYSTITLEWDSWHVPPIVSLLRTLIQRPGLFSHINSLSMFGKGFEVVPHTPLDKGKLPLDQAISAIEKTQVPYNNLWADRLRSGSSEDMMEALVGLLIANASKISFLAITHNFHGYKIISQVLRSKANGQLPRFERLKRLIYSRQMNPLLPDTDSDFPDIIPLFYLPTVTELVFAMPTPKVFQWPIREPSFGNLTSLEIEFGYPRCVGEILASSCNLKSFFWNWKYDGWATVGSDSALDYDQIVAAVLPLRSTLERLCFRLCLRNTLAMDPPRINTVGSWNGLRDFERLVYLDVPLVSLAGIGPVPQPIERHIPEGIEELCLTASMLTDQGAAQWMMYPEWGPDWESWEMIMEEYHGGDYIMPLIRALTERCRPGLPRLRGIYFLLQRLDLWPSGLAPLMKELSMECGIKIEFQCELSWERRHLPATG